MDMVSLNIVFLKFNYTAIKPLKQAGANKYSRAKFIF